MNCLHALPLTFFFGIHYGSFVDITFACLWCVYIIRFMYMCCIWYSTLYPSFSINLSSLPRLPYPFLPSYPAFLPACLPPYLTLLHHIFPLTGLSLATRLFPHGLSSRHDFTFLMHPPYRVFLSPYILLSLSITREVSSTLCFFDLSFHLPSTLTFTFCYQPSVFHLHQSLTHFSHRLFSLSSLPISIVHQPPHTRSPFPSHTHSDSHSHTQPTCIPRSLPTSLSLPTSQTTMNANREYLPQSYFCLEL